MIRVDHLTLPAGLDAIARRTGPGELYVVVCDTLDPRQQRAAVRMAVRAARRHAWEFGFLPLPLVAAAPALRGGAQHLGHLLRAHGSVSAIAGSLAAGAAAATAAVFVVAAPHPHGHTGAIAPASPGYTQPAGPGAHPARGARPGVPAPGQSRGTSPRAITVARPKTAAPQPGPQPSPTASSYPQPTMSTRTSSPPAQPQPTASSSPPASSGGGATCVIVLGIEVCL